MLLLTETPRHDHALKLALRAHDADLCYVRDVPEFAAFLPAAAAAEITIDLVVIDHDFDPMAFNIAAANRLNFRMLPEGAGESRALAEILSALPQQQQRRVLVGREHRQQHIPRLIVRPRHLRERADLLRRDAERAELRREARPVRRRPLQASVRPPRAATGRRRHAASDDRGPRHQP